MLASKVESEIEQKVAYYSATGGHDYSGSTANLLTNLVRGDGVVNNFTGIKIDPKWIRLRYAWSSTSSFNTCRVILYQWSDSSTPAASSVLAATGSAIAPFSYLLADNRNIIHVLYDETVSISPTDSQDVASRVITIQAKDLGKFRVDAEDSREFSTTINAGILPVTFASGATNPIENGLYLLSISDDGAAGYPQLSIATEVWFTDA